MPINYDYQAYTKLNPDFAEVYRIFKHRHPEHLPSPDVKDYVVCNVCGSAFKRFIKIGSSPVYSHLYGLCPVCLSKARTRFLFNFILTEDFTNKTVLHFAPEFPLWTYLKKIHNCSYYDCDINQQCRYCCDIKNIQFDGVNTNNYFDYIICNHVLEHIIDDKLAISELFRVLAPYGKAFISVPIFDQAVEIAPQEQELLTEQDRVRLFHQEDHVRKYSINTLRSRLSNAGFKVSIKTDQQLSEDYVKRFCLEDWDSELLDQAQNYIKVIQQENQQSIQVKQNNNINDCIENYIINGKLDLPKCNVIFLCTKD